MGSKCMILITYFALGLRQSKNRTKILKLIMNQIYFIILVWFDFNSSIDIVLKSY